MWQDTTYTVCLHHFVFLNPSSCSLGLFSFKDLFTSLSEGIIKRARQTVYRPRLCPVCITSPYTLTMLMLLFAFLVPKIFWRQHIFGPDVFLIFVVDTSLSLLRYVFLYVVGWSCIFQYSFMKRHPWKCHWSSVYKKTENTLLKGCSRQNIPVKLNSVHTLICWPFFFIC